MGGKRKKENFIRKTKAEKIQKINLGKSNIKPQNIKLIQNKVEQNENKQKTNIKIIDLNSTVSIIILHVNSLNILIK